MTQDRPLPRELSARLSRPSTGRTRSSCCPSWSLTCGSTGSRLRQDWAGRINEAHLLQAMTPQEMAAETTSVYDNYVEVLETGSVEALQHYARDLSERIIPARCGDARGRGHRAAAA